MTISTNLYLQNVVSGSLKNAKITNHTDLNLNELDSENPIFYYRPVIFTFNIYDRNFNTTVEEFEESLIPIMFNKKDIKFKCQIRLLKDNQELIAFEMDNFHMSYPFSNKAYLGVATRLSRKVFDGVAVPLPKLNGDYTLEINETWYIVEGGVNIFRRKITLPISTGDGVKFDSDADMFKYFNDLDYDNQLLFGISYNRKGVYSENATSNQNIALRWDLTTLYYDHLSNLIFSDCYDMQAKQTISDALAADQDIPRYLLSIIATTDNFKLNQVANINGILEYKLPKLIINT